MPNTHEVLATSVCEKRNSTMDVIADHAQVDAVRVHRPRLYFSETMARGVTHGIDDAGIVRDGCPGVVPPIESVTEIAPVAQAHAFFEQRGLGAEH